MARKRDSADALMIEGDTPWADAGVALSALEANGYFAEVTDAHRAKARAYFARIEARRVVARQPDLFAAMGLGA